MLLWHQRLVIVQEAVTLLIDVNMAMFIQFISIPRNFVYHENANRSGRVQHRCLLIRNLSRIFLWAHTQLFSGSLSRFFLASTTKEPKEKSRKANLASMREAFNNAAIESTNCIPLCCFVAAAHTKDNWETVKLTLRTIRTVIYPTHPNA